MVRWLSVPLASLLLAAPAAAQSRDFLFSHPHVTLGFRIGFAAPTASSDIFDFMAEELARPGSGDPLQPLDRSDFDGLDVQGELAVRVHDRVDVALNVAHSESSIRSEFRDWVGTDDLPIEQTTEFSRTPVTIGLKGYLRDRGRSISRFAWVPYGWAPYVTAGAGFVVYDFFQRGEFVDYEDFDVFPASYVSEGTAAAAHAGAGVELSLGKHLIATGEARYLWSEAEMSRDFVDFDDIDLSGAQIALGLALRF
jgi:hypothetical protein